MISTYLGVDVGGTTVKVGIFSADGTILDKWEVPTRTQEGGCHILPDVAETVAQHTQPDWAMQAVGVGVPGPVTTDGRVLGCVNLGWGEFDLTGTASALFGVPAAAGNDANLAALGEQWLGAGRGEQDVVMVTLGTGVGGGIVTDGVMLVGRNGSGGEIGHIPVNIHETARCNCGQCGCLEQYASATGMVRVAGQMLAATDAPSALRDQELTARALFDCAKAGDGLANEIVDVVCTYLGVGLGTLGSVLDPALFLIGGGVAKAGEILIERTQPIYKKHVFHSARNARFAMATLGNDAGICGAAKLAMECSAAAQCAMNDE